MLQFFDQRILPVIRSLQTFMSRRGRWQSHDSYSRNLHQRTDVQTRLESMQRKPQIHFWLIQIVTSPCPELSTEVTCGPELNMYKGGSYGEKNIAPGSCMLGVTC